MRLNWTRSLLVFSAAVVLATSCTKPEFSADEPLIAEQRDNLYIISDGNILYAMDPETGNVRWKYHDFRGMPYEPLALDGYVFAVVPDNVLKLDARDGTVVDSLFSKVGPAEGGHKVLGPIIGQGNYLYVPYEVTPGVNGFTTGLAQFDHTQAGTPKTPVNFTAQLPSGLIPGVPVLPTSPLFLGNKMLIPWQNKMELVQVAPTAPLAWSASGANPNNPVTDGQVVYVCSGSLLGAFDLNTGLQLWSYNAGDFISTSPIVHGRNVIFGCEDKKLYCIDPDAQAPRWIFETNERVYSSPVAYDQTVYFGSNDHHFYALNIIDGTVKWKYRTGALIRSSAIAHEGTVYIGGYDLNMYAFDTSGALKWKSALNGLVDQSPVLFDAESKIGVYAATSGLSKQ